MLWRTICFSRTRGIWVRARGWWQAVANSRHSHKIGAARTRCATRIAEVKEAEMYSKQNWRKGILLINSALFALMLLQSTFSFSQATISTGSIAGTVTDPSGAVVEGAKVVITNINTDRTIELTTNSAGTFNSAALQPGTYQLTVTQKGFNAVNATTTVQVGNISTVNVKMPLGQESTTVEVQA